MKIMHYDKQGKDLLDFFSSLAWFCQLFGQSVHVQCMMLSWLSSSSSWSCTFFVIRHFRKISFPNEARSDFFSLLLIALNFLFIQLRPIFQAINLRINFFNIYNCMATLGQQWHNCQTLMTKQWFALKIFLSNVS